MCASAAVQLRPALIWYLLVDAKSKVGQDLKRLPCILEVVGSSLGQDMSRLETGFSWPASVP
jgi:hypothetical protein